MGWRLSHLISGAFSGFTNYRPILEEAGCHPKRPPAVRDAVTKQFILHSFPDGLREVKINTSKLRLKELTCVKSSTSRWFSHGALF